MSKGCSACGAGDGAVDVKLLCCARCKVAAYCSKSCQQKHWKEGGHKQECPKLTAGQNGSVPLVNARSLADKVPAELGVIEIVRDIISRPVFIDVESVRRGGKVTLKSGKEVTMMEVSLKAMGALAIPDVPGKDFSLMQ